MPHTIVTSWKRCYSLPVPSGNYIQIWVETSSIYKNACHFATPAACLAHQLPPSISSVPISNTVQLGPGRHQGLHKRPCTVSIDAQAGQQTDAAAQT